MTTPKLLKKVATFLEADKSKLQEQHDDLKAVLKKLKKKEVSLKKLLAKETNEKRQKQLKKDLAIIFVQRKKGIKLLKALK